MGFSVSWIAVKEKPKTAVLTTLGLIDTNELDEANESEFSGAELPGGWYMVFLNEIVHPFNRKPMLTQLSEGCDVLICQVEEHVMASSAFLYSHGEKVWDVTHESEKGIYNLSIEGNPPSSLQAIHADLKASQDSEGGEDADVDYVFDVPVALAEKLCGYRHDRVELASGVEPKFTALQVANA